MGARRSSAEPLWHLTPSRSFDDTLETLYETLLSRQEK
jgi:hypothetical protein